VILPGLPPIDPLNIRPLLMLDVAHEMMLSKNWPLRAVSVVFESHTDPAARFSFYGANHPNSIDEVHQRRVDVAILNPVALLNMARLGRGAYDRPREVATIAVLPHDDRLGFAVADRLGFPSLTEIAAARYPLRVSVRGSLDAATSISVDVVLRSHGFSLADITGWGGTVNYDQPMPMRGDIDRIGRLASGEIDAIFEEGTILWADAVAEAGASLLPIDDEHLRALEEQGFRRGVIEKSRYPSLPADVHTVDYSGWPVFCRTDTPGLVVEQFCRGLESAKDHLVWDLGPVTQAPLPLARMVLESPSTPFDVPLHPRAQAVWKELGYLT
jgi:NMT1-like family